MNNFQSNQNEKDNLNFWFQSLLLGYTYQLLEINEIILDLDRRFLPYNEPIYEVSKETLDINREILQLTKDNLELDNHKLEEQTKSEKLLECISESLITNNQLLTSMNENINSLIQITKERSIKNE